MGARFAKRLVKIKKVQCIKEGLFYAHWVIGEMPGDLTGSEDQNWDRFQKRKEEYFEAWRMAVEEFPFDIIPIPTKRSESEAFRLILAHQALHDPSPFGRYSGARKRARGFRKRQIKRLIRRLIKWIITRLDTFLKIELREFSGFNPSISHCCRSSSIVLQNSRRRCGPMAAASTRGPHPGRTPASD